MKSPVRIAPSILAADLLRLGDEIRDADAGGADWIHIDVMDGVYVPNISFGPATVAAARRATQLPLDVHLMVANPDHHVEAFAEAGASTITVHVEAATHLQRVLSSIRKFGVRPAVVLNPHTPESAIDYVLEDVEQVLVMTVNPGFGGQPFLHSQLAKLEAIASNASKRGLRLDIEVDGGITAKTAPLVVDAGANVLVAGTAVFGAPDRRAAIDGLRQAVAG